MIRLLTLTLVIVTACEVKNQESKNIDIQGHRGARGLAPENSIPAFLLATELGVNTLELDLVVSGDGLLIVSHEPFFSPVFCLDAQGNVIPEDSVINIYELTYEQIRQFDCGIKGNPGFPEQKLISTHKPLLSEVVDSVAQYIRDNKLREVNYNIELKSQQGTDTIFHPAPDVFSQLVYSFLKDREMIDKVTIQSFDFRVLQYFRENYTEVKLALLIENKDHWKANIDSLGFTPEIYSCYYQLLSQEKVREIQDAGMLVIPWTVNEIADMNKFLTWGVDGIITDYPDRAMSLTQKE